MTASAGGCKGFAAMDYKSMLGLIAAASLPTAACAATAFDESRCYDLKVEARLIDQIPSHIPDCDDCITMSWPWFLDLKVRHIIEGDKTGKMIRVLSVQHTYLYSRYETWLLRKNSAGIFNVAYRDDGLRPTRCPSTDAPARPYLSAKDKSLDDLRQEGIDRYGHHPGRR